MLVLKGICYISVMQTFSIESVILQMNLALNIREVLLVWIDNINSVCKVVQMWMEFTEIMHVCVFNKCFAVIFVFQILHPFYARFMGINNSTVICRLRIY